MIWIEIYLLIGVAAATLVAVCGMPRDVRLLDILAIPFFVAFWPAVVFLIVMNVRLFERQKRSFTVGEEQGKSDGTD